MLKEVDEIGGEVKEEIPVVATGEEIMTAENGEDIFDSPVVEDVNLEDVDDKPLDHSVEESYEVSD